MNKKQSHSDVTLQNILAEHVEALVTGRLSRAKLLAKYNLAPDSYEARLLEIAERLNEAVPLVRPRDEFVAHLYEELVGVRARSPWERWARRQMDRLPNLTVPNLHSLPMDVGNLSSLRQLPPHMQLAAGLGGLTLLVIAARAVLENTNDEATTNSLAEIVTTIRSA